jgi:hypothetical protein
MDPVMTPNEYQLNCLRTVPTRMHFWEHRGELLEIEMRNNLLANAALGLCGEAREFIKTPTTDEAGDCYWYVAVAAQAVGVYLASLVYNTNFEIATGRRVAGELLYDSACRFAELAKKVVFHDKSIDIYLPEMCECLATYLYAVDYLDETQMDICMEQNISKLRARYPDGFDSARK